MSLLNTPLELPCGAVIPNRICKAAMTEGLADPYGTSTPALEKLYQRWSEGGAGLLLTGNVMVDHRYLERAGNVIVENDKHLDALKRYAEAGTKAGNHLWMQISHPGRQCARLVNDKPMSPSDVQLKMAGNYAKPTPMTASDIDDVIERFVTTATIAKQAGFTGVQIHSAHGYLNSQFLSPVTNQRTDQWGGSLANRARLILTIVRRVRDAVGAEFPICVKLNSADFQKGGFTLEECIQVAAWLGEERVDLLEISGGTYEHLTFFDEGHNEQRKSTQAREAYFMQYAKAISEAAKIPLMITGGFRSRQGMEDALESKETDMVGVARPFCVDPDVAKKLLSGEIESTPSYDNKLVLGKGFWGPTSKSKTMQAFNNQCQAGWYYRHIIDLSEGKRPDVQLSARKAFFKHMINDFKLTMTRRKAMKNIASA